MGIAPFPSSKNTPIYSNAESCIHISRKDSRWFLINNGVRQICDVTLNFFDSVINPLITSVREYLPVLILYGAHPSRPLGCRIHWLHLCRGVRHPPTNEYPGYDSKQSDGGVPVMLELWGKQNTPSLSSIPGPLWPIVVAPDMVLSMGQIELNCILMLNWSTWNRTVLIFNCILMLNWTAWNRNVFNFKTQAHKQCYPC